MAQAQAPPQSASMPGTLWSTAARISDTPLLASTSWLVPLYSMKMTLGMVLPGGEWGGRRRRIIEKFESKFKF